MTAFIVAITGLTFMVIGFVLVISQHTTRSDEFGTAHCGLGCIALGTALVFAAVLAVLWALIRWGFG